RHAVRKFADFLDDPDSHTHGSEFLPFGSVELRGYAVAVHGLSSAEPFGIAELFHDAFASAERHRDRASQSQRRLKGTVAAVAAAFAALLLGAAVEWFQPKPADPGLAEQVQSFRDREPPPGIRLAEKNLPRNRRALAAFHADPGFERLPVSLRDFVEGRLREIDNYREYFARLQTLPCPADARSLEELDRCEGILQGELALPLNYNWDGTEAAQLRDKWLADIPLLRGAEAKWQEWYRGLVNQALALTHAASFEGEWRANANAVAAGAERKPFDADAAIPGSRSLPQPRGEAVTYKVAAEFDRVYQASRDWDFARARLTHLGELADALGLTAASNRVLVIPPAGGMPPSEWIKRIDEACPAPEAWRLANFPQPGRTLLAARLHESIGHGANRVKRILAAKLTADSPEAYRRLADTLEEPAIRDWGRLLTLLLRLDDSHAADPLEELAAFLRTKEFAIDAKGFELTIPLSLRVPPVLPSGKLTIAVTPPTGTAEIIAFEHSGEGVSHGLTTVYQFVPEKPAALSYHPGDGLKLELPVRSGEQRFTLSWADGATMTFHFDRWQREPKLVSASGSEPATGVKLTMLSGSRWPRLPLLLPALSPGK
ncbi:MAG TPA: hypothetical protein VN641_12390, partial [Urbifossiella sp.]|nr:hypothetical protein [Urbifossiella sp.]